MTHDPNHVRSLMNGMYRWTRYVYDASRKYYLFGRDKLLDQITCPEDTVIIEVGCGTARNLIKLAKRYPNARFFGIDASDEMLKTAHQSITKAGLANRIQLAQGFAESFNPQSLFAVEKADRIFFSYSLSMIPPWQNALTHAKTLLNQRGEIWIVDFADLAGLPTITQKILRFWLKLFHVTPREDLINYLKNQPNTQLSFGTGHYYFISKLN